MTARPVSGYCGDWDCCSRVVLGLVLVALFTLGVATRYNRLRAARA